MRIKQPVTYLIPRFFAQSTFVQDGRIRTNRWPYKTRQIVGHGLCLAQAVQFLDPTFHLEYQTA